MFPGRFLIIMIAIIWFMISPNPATAGWWFGDDGDWSKSGLDIEKSFDRNTVVTVKGEILKTDFGSSSGPALAEIKTQKDIVTLVLCPGNYWQESGISLKKGDEVSVRGSKAQGKNGKIYLMVENISLATGSDTVILRSVTGRPAWSGRNRPETQRMAPMRQFRGGRNR